jgi:ABC-2 type transport system permease protein
MSDANAETPAGLAEAFSTLQQYFRHVWIIVELETLKILKDPTEILSRSVQPALWLVLFGGAMRHTQAFPTGGTDYLAFLAPGILAQSITFVSIFNGLAVIWEKDMGILHKLLTTPIRHSALVLGKMLASSVRSLSQLMVILLLTLILGIHLEWGLMRGLGVLVMVVLGSAFFTGLSMIIASLVKTRERMMGIGQLVTMPLFFASSALYPVAIMPTWLKALARVNPLSFLVDGLRGLMLNPTFTGLPVDVLFLAVASLVVLFVAAKVYPRLLT